MCYLRTSGLDNYISLTLTLITRKTSATSHIMCIMTPEILISMTNDRELLNNLKIRFYLKLFEAATFLLPSCRLDPNF